MSAQKNRLIDIQSQLKRELTQIEPNVDRSLQMAVSLAEEQIGFAVHLLEIRERHEDQQQMQLPDGKSAAAGRDE